MRRLPTRAGVALIVLGALALGGPAIADERPRVVATFTVLGDMTARIGGTLVDIVTLVGPGGDVHIFDPRPSDARAVDGADLVIANGLGFENFLPGLIASTGYTQPVVVASDGIAPRSGATVSGLDPHAWHDLANARIYVENIERGLARLDPQHAPDFHRNAAEYLTEIDRLDAEIRAMFADLPPDRRLIVTSHDALGYFGAAYGLVFKGAEAMSTGAESSAQDVARLIDEIHEQGVLALFVEILVNPALIEQIARETGVQIGGRLYTGALSDASGPAPTFLDMVRTNALTIAAAMAGG